jgi:acetyl esterase/lipase
VGRRLRSDTVATAAADRRIFEAAPRQCARSDGRRSETKPLNVATDEIHVKRAFGAKPIRVLTYRPVTSDDPLPVIVHIHGGAS